MRTFGTLVAVTILAAGCAPSGGDNSAATDANALLNASDTALAEVDAAVADATNMAGPSPDQAAEPATAWTYDTQTDPLTDKVTRTACVTSTNEVQLSSPYGPTQARLCLRDSPQFGRDAYVSLVGDGQILCRSYEDCEVQVRFGKGQVQSMAAVGPSDGSTDMFFIRQRERIERELKKVDQVIVQAEFYQAGNQPMIFPTKGFAWPKTSGE